MTIKPLPADLLMACERELKAQPKTDDVTLLLPRDAADGLAYLMERHEAGEEIMGALLGCPPPTISITCTATLDEGMP